jgi:putative ABC transport system substrate-binding protein
MELVRAHAESLLTLKADIVVATGGRVIPVLMQMTRTVPIIVPGAADPVGTGWIESLARPGGNVTGLTGFELSIIGKQLDTLKEIAPRTARVTMIYNPDNPNTGLYGSLFEKFASQLAIEPVLAPIHNIGDIDRVLENVGQQQDAAVFFASDLTLSQLREQITPLVARRRLPAIYSDRALVESGGLLSYDTDRVELFRRAASYVDRVLRGEKPGDLPFEQPTKYQLVINLKTAKALKLDVPATVLARADEVIE